MDQAAVQKTWWGRNWKWLVPIGCGILLIVAAFVLGILALVSGMMRSSAPYKEALARAQSHPAVIQALGQPIKAGFIVTGSIRINFGSGYANLSIRISGPKGKARVHVNATKGGGTWSYNEIMVTVERQPTPIDLLAFEPHSTTPIPMPID